jgi:hypothetical protein
MFSPDDGCDGCGTVDTVHGDRCPKMPPAAAASPEEFTVRDALTWLGIPWEIYVKSEEILSGRHGSPIRSALLDARRARGTDTTAAQILAQHGIDPADPLAAVRAYDKGRRTFDA